MDSGSYGRRIFLAACLAASTGCWAHGVHLGMTAIALRDQDIEIDHHLSLPDVSQLLFNLYGLEPDWRAASIHGVLRRYVEARFAILDGEGHSLPLHWVSCERRAEMLRVRQQLSPATLFVQARFIRHALLTDFLQDQVNIVAVRLGGDERILRMTSGLDTVALP